MGTIGAIFQWIVANYVNVFLALAALVGVAELVVRFTPTKTDDGAVERIGAVIRKIMNFLKIPNKASSEAPPLPPSDGSSK